MAALLLGLGAGACGLASAYLFSSGAHSRQQARLINDTPTVSVEEAVKRVVEATPVGTLPRARVWLKVEGQMHSTLPPDSLSSEYKSPIDPNVIAMEEHLYSVTNVPELHKSLTGRTHTRRSHPLLEDFDAASMIGAMIGFDNEAWNKRETQEETQSTTFAKSYTHLSGIQRGKANLCVSDAAIPQCLLAQSSSSSSEAFPRLALAPWQLGPIWDVSHVEEAFHGQTIEELKKPTMTTTPKPPGGGGEAAPATSSVGHGGVVINNTVTGAVATANGAGGGSTTTAASPLGYQLNRKTLMARVPVYAMGVFEISDTEQKELDYQSSRFGNSPRRAKFKTMTVHEYSTERMPWYRGGGCKYPYKVSTAPLSEVAKEYSADASTRFIWGSVFSVAGVVLTGFAVHTSRPN